MRHGWIKATMILSIVVRTTSLVAAPTVRLQPGIGRYIMVLQVPGTGPDAIKHVVEPDVTKLGGKVLNQHENDRVIELPVAAAQQLRSDINVAYLQRVWMGEPLDKWDERPAPSKVPARRMATNSETGLTWSTGTFAYDGSGNIKAMGADWYVYDSVGRITQATVNGVTETYGYDSFGNLTQKTITGDPLSVPIPPIDSSTNRLVRESYDVAGNVTSNGFKNSYVYDAVGMMALNMTMLGQNRRMIYTADDERIGIQIDSSSTQWEIRDINGSQVLREFTGPTVGFQYRSWMWMKDWVYAEGKLVAGEAYDGGQRHYSLDHLGSVRMVTNDAKMRYGRHDYYPFGREQTVSIQEAVNFGSYLPRNDRMKFAGHERDFNGPQGVENTDYLDYMHARFYDPNQGRFLSVDKGSFDIRQPATFNRYTYAHNNPLTAIDPDGRNATKVVTDTRVIFTIHANISGPGAGDVAKRMQAALTEKFKGAKIHNRSVEVRLDSRTSEQPVVGAADQMRMQKDKRDRISVAPLGENPSHIMPDATAPAGFNYHDPSRATHGTFDPSADGATLAHEGGHELGLPDRSVDGASSLCPNGCSFMDNPWLGMPTAEDLEWMWTAIPTAEDATDGSAAAPKQKN